MTETNPTFDAMERLIVRTVTKLSGRVTEIDKLALTTLRGRWADCSEATRSRWFAWVQKTVVQIDSATNMSPSSTRRASALLLTYPLSNGRRGWDIPSLMSLGDQLWHMVEYSTDDAIIEPHIREVVRYRDDDTSISARYTWLYRWTEMAFPTVKISAPFAAACMTTLAPDDVLDDLRLPWRSFLIDMPMQPVLYMFDQRDSTASFPVARIGVSFDDTTSRWTLMITGTSDNEIVSAGLASRSLGRSVHYCPECGGNHTVHPVELVEHPWDEFTDQHDKTMMLVGRLVVGVICAITDPKEVAKVNRHAHDQWGTRTKRSGEMPEQRIYQITTPVKVDLVEHVTEYQLHKQKGKWSLALRRTVAGHRKMQPCGPHHSQRTRIWIQPYWRGPLDAPIAVRSHIIKSEQTEE